VLGGFSLAGADRQLMKMRAVAETVASGFVSHDAAQGRSCRALPMRDLVLVMSPIAAVFYFLVNQDQFRDLLAWLGTFVH
jgi:hypothetical protein